MEECAGCRCTGCVEVVEYVIAMTTMQPELHEIHAKHENTAANETEALIQK